MAAISADARPTFSADVRRAAVAQKITPSTALPPEDTINATAFWIRFPAHTRLFERRACRGFERGVGPICSALLMIGDCGLWT